MKELLHQAIQDNLTKICEVGRDLFVHPEIGFQEAYTEEAICKFLDALGISYKRSISVHGVVCQMGKGDGYHIGVVADMDALLTSNEGQMIPYHSCGHSIQVTVLLNVIQALHKTKLLDKTGGKVSFIFTPAEEFIDIENREKLRQEGKISYYSGKQNMIVDGVFDDIDCVLSCHVMGYDEKYPHAKFDVESSLVGFLLKKAVFKGQTAHAGVFPHLGRNALLAASLSLQAIQSLKDIFAPEANAKVYPILQEGGKSPNVICDYAVIETYIRCADKKNLYKINDQISHALACCASALETTCEIHDTPGYLPFVQDKALSEVVYQNMLGICQADEIVRGRPSGASGDIGDVSYLLPTIQFGFSGIEGVIHSNHFDIVDETHVYSDTAKVIADTIYELLTNPSLQIKNPDYKARKEAYLHSWLQHNQTQ